jgi:hypothetical protein
MAVIALIEGTLATADTLAELIDIQILFEYLFREYIQTRFAFTFFFMSADSIIFKFHLALVSQRTFYSAIIIIATYV